MCTFGYWLVALLCLFSYSGISIIMLLLYPVLLVGHAFITGVIEGSQNRRAAREAATQSYEPQRSQLPAKEADSDELAATFDPSAAKIAAAEFAEEVRLLELERQMLNAYK